MGARQSTFHGSQPPTQGLHVLRVTPSSPASYSDIEPFFDFIVGFEGDSLSSDKPINISGLEKIVEGHEGTTLKLLVWNNKTQRTRGASRPIGDPCIKFNCVSCANRSFKSMVSTTHPQRWTGQKELAAFAIGSKYAPLSTS